MAALSSAEAQDRTSRLLDWTVAESAGHLQLTKTYRFKGFMPGVALVNKIAKIAEAEAHHPDLHLSYGSLRIDLWTHASGGLTEKDFALAAKIDSISSP